MGTTDQVTSLDPAGAYDQGSWNVFGNTFQTLLSLPSGADQPVPDAAAACGFTDKTYTAYRCTVRDGLRFSNGDALTADDVAYSFERVKRIDSPNGPAPLLTTLDSVRASGDRVMFRLTTADATFPFKLATEAGSIVDSHVYPSDRLLGGNRLVGSGVYEVASYTRGKQLVLAPNTHYKGVAGDRFNNGATIRYYSTPGALATALKNHQVDFVPRGLPPAVENSYENDGGTSFQTSEESSSQTRFLVFDTTHGPFANAAVRRAVALVVDREALARDVYARTVQPLYSLIPQGILGHTNAFFDTYGSAPDVEKARQLLRAAGISTPVSFTLTASSGPAAMPEANELKDELDRSGLFSVSVQHVDWTDFEQGWVSHRFPAFAVGWSADYPDPDDFIAPLVGRGGVFHNGYDDSQVDSLITRTRMMVSRPAADSMFAGLQDIETRDVPILPLWQSKDYAVSTSAIEGASLSRSGAGVTCLWEVGVGASG